MQQQRPRKWKPLNAWVTHTITQVDSDWPKPVVYVLFNEGMPVWVGQSGNLPNRLYGHQEARRAYTFVWYIEVPLHLLNDIEYALIVRVRPSDNVRVIQPNTGGLCSRELT